MEKKPKEVVTDEEELFLEMYHKVFEQKMTDNNLTHTHIVNGNTHFDYSNLNRDKKQMFNSKILTFRRKCKATNLSLGDLINEAEQMTAAALEEERKKQEQKQRLLLRGEG